MKIKSDECSECKALVGPENSCWIGKKRVCVYCFPAIVEKYEWRIKSLKLFVSSVMSDVDNELMLDYDRVAELAGFCTGSTPSVRGKSYDYYSKFRIDSGACDDED